LIQLKLVKLNKPILFIVSDFYPGGAQREMYEIDLFCKRKSIEIGILSISSLNQHPYFSDFFYEKHLALGTKVHLLEQIFPKQKTSIQDCVLNKLKRALSLNKMNKLSYYFENIDKIIFVGEYTLSHSQYFVNKEGIPIINVMIMCSRFQGEHYRRLNKKIQYNFVSGFALQKEIDYEFEGFENFTHSILPLSIDEPNNQWKKWKFNDKCNKKIGIFTRLTKEKPLDPFFYTFHLLQKENPTLELHIFGAGDPEEAEYNRYISHLNLKNVHFRGHQVDIKTTLNAENLDLVWFQGYLNRPAGYAGFDTALTGTPQLFWDFFNGDNLEINNLSEIYPHFKDIVKFAKASFLILNEKGIAEKLAEKQFTDVLENRSMERNIKNVANFLG